MDRTRTGPGRGGVELTDESGAAAPDLSALVDELRDVVTERSVRYGDFVLASGAKSHYYCDAKLTLLTPRGAWLVGKALHELLRRFPVEAVGGMAMGAAYIAAAVASVSDGTPKPLYGFTVRPERKGHGRGQSIDQAWHPEGGKVIRPGRRVAIVDDVVTTAGSLLRSLDAVVAEGCEVPVVTAIVDRQAGGAESIRARGVSFHPLLVADQEGRLRPGLDLDTLPPA